MNKYLQKTATNGVKATRALLSLYCFIALAFCHERLAAESLVASTRTNPFANPARALHTPLRTEKIAQAFSLAELKLVAIYGRPKELTAVFLNPKGELFHVRVGKRIAREGAEIRDIHSTSVQLVLPATESSNEVKQEQLLLLTLGKDSRGMPSP